MTTRIIFMGTPDFAVPSLTQLNQMYQVVTVVTQPDRRSGRGRKITFSAVKQAAKSLELPLLQPKTLKDPQVLAQLQALNPDLIVVAAFGQILRANVLDLPRLGCINVHASLLPRWRGAAPVSAAIRAGDTETGVTIMKMDPGLDTGPMLKARAIPITAQHTRASLTAELAQVGADLLLETLPGWIAGEITPQVQDESLVTLAPQIKKEEGVINWHQSAVAIERHIRAFDPWPSAFIYWQGIVIKILKAKVVPNQPETIPPGQVFMLNKEVAVATTEGAVVLQQIKPAGKGAMLAADFVRGTPGFIGAQI